MNQLLMQLIARNPGLARVLGLGARGLGGPVGLALTPAEAVKYQYDPQHTDSVIGRQGAGATPNAYVGKGFDTFRYYPGTSMTAPDGSYVPPNSPGAPAPALQPGRNIGPGPGANLGQPMQAPGPTGSTYDPNGNNIAGWGTQPNNSGEPDLHMTTSGPSLIKKFMQALMNSNSSGN